MHARRSRGSPTNTKHSVRLSTSATDTEHLVPFDLSTWLQKRTSLRFGRSCTMIGNGNATSSTCLLDSKVFFHERGSVRRVTECGIETDGLRTAVQKNSLEPVLHRPSFGKPKQCLPDTGTPNRLADN